MVYLLKTNCNKYPKPFCYHYAIQFDIDKTKWVTDNTPDHNVALETLDNFKETRIIYEKTKLPNVSSQDVQDAIVKYGKKKFNYWNFNCKQYAMLIAKGKKGLSTLQKGAIGLGAVGVLSLLFKK
jgi:hypothetical protein